MKKILLFVLVLSITPVILFSQTATPPSAGDGTSGNPYQIATLENLYWIQQNSGVWNKCFLQTADIDASSTVGWNSGTGWAPIGVNSNFFYGTYDGNYYVISGLYIHQPSTSYTGLFGIIGDVGTVKKLGVTNVNILADLGVGALSGRSYGLVENCFATGSVSGIRQYIGGLVGSNPSTGVVRGCYSHVNVIGGGNIGSLVGENYNGGLIQNSYATGTVAGNNTIGGLSGSNYLGTIVNSYSTGSSSGGGLVGISSTCTNSFWDTTSSGNTSSAGGTGKSTAEMKTLSTFTNAGWDFTTIWEMVAGNYPRLRAIPDSTLAVGVETNNYTPEQFLLNQNYPNPFNPTTNIPFSIGKSGHTFLRIYDLLGREIATLIDEYKSAGSYTMPWNASGVSSGIYFYKLTTGQFLSIRKMILTK